MRKICVVVLSRASYARIKSALKHIDRHPELELQLIVGASALLWRYGDIRETVKRDGFEIAGITYSIVEGENPTTMAKSTGVTIMELSTLFERLKPDVVLTIADRFETIATAITAAYMNTPVAHVQGGEITGNIDDKVRHAVTKLSDIHFPATSKAAARIVTLSEDAKKVFCTGCPSIDLLVDTDLTMDRMIFSQHGHSSETLDPKKPFLLALQHPVTTEFGQGLDQIKETLVAVNSVGMQTVWLWPNVDAGSDHIARGLRIFKEENPGSKIQFILNFTPEDYARLLANTACIIGNSSSAIREGSFLGTPAVNVGSRQDRRERAGNVVEISIHQANDIYDAIQYQSAMGARGYKSSHLYGDGKAGERIADILSTVDLGIKKGLCYV